MALNKELIAELSTLANKYALLVQSTTEPTPPQTAPTPTSVAPQTGITAAMFSSVAPQTGTTAAPITGVKRLREADRKRNQGVQPRIPDHYIQKGTTGDDARTCKYPNCNRILSDFAHLKKHFFAVHLGSHHVCDSCEETTVSCVSRDAMVKHHKSFHSGKPQYHIELKADYISTFFEDYDIDRSAIPYLDNLLE